MSRQKRKTAQERNASMDEAALIHYGNTALPKSIYSNREGDHDRHGPMVALTAGVPRRRSIAALEGTSLRSVVVSKSRRLSLWSWSPILLVGAATVVFPHSAVAGWNTTPEPIEGHPSWIFTPSTARPDGKHPLLIALHGCDQSHTQLKEFGNLIPAAEANGTVVAVPGVGSKVFGPGCWDYNLASDSKQHIAEIVRLAGILKARTALNVDPAHVYIVGLSSGAAMALAVGCKAPHVFAGIGAIAGPSAGSSQLIATQPGSSIPATNVSAAISKCRSLAGNNKSHFDTQIANIAFGDMDRDGPKARFPFSLGAKDHPGQFALVSVKWSQDNAEILKSIYSTGSLDPGAPEQNGLGTLQVAQKDNRSRLSLLTIHDVGHAWPAGTNSPNSFNQGGNWIAQSGLNYPGFVVSWLISNNIRAVPVGTPELTATAAASGAMVSISGTATDPDGSITRVDTELLKASPAGAFLHSDSHGNIPLNPPGSYSDSYGSLSDGRYKARVTATDNAGNTATELTPTLTIGNPPPPEVCHDFTDNNFIHVQKGRALQCSFGFTCAKGSGENLGLFSFGITSTVKETSTEPGIFRKGTCPAV
jgi:poly(3-hydroxybutyrate) depolymerase